MQQRKTHVTNAVKRPVEKERGNHSWLGRMQQYRELDGASSWGSPCSYSKMWPFSCLRRSASMPRNKPIMYAATRLSVMTAFL